MKTAFVSLALAASVVVAGLVPGPASAQTYPSRPVRLVCPFPAGGSVDIASRAVAQELGKTLGQPVIVENRAGAGGNLGGDAVAKAAPDGYTMLMTYSGLHAINPVLYARMSFDPNRDLAPVAPVVGMHNVLVVHPSLTVGSVKELIAMAKAQPGKLTYASGGGGTSIHMSGEMFKYMAGVDILHVGYKGSAPALIDVMSGQVHMMFDNIPTSLPHIRAGKLRALATTGARRASALPDLPTVAEAGVPGFESGAWMGLAVPAGTPREIVTRLNAAAARATRSPEFVKRMGDLNFDVLSSTPEQMADMLKAEIVRWAPVVKASGAKAD